MKRIGKLHVLTDTVLQNRFSHIELAIQAISGGADTIQFRQKNGSTKELIEIATKMKHVCSEMGAAFIVNDRIDVAIACEADGVHLGQDDFPILLARKLLGENRIIGGSAGTPEEIEICLRGGGRLRGFRAHLCHRQQGRCGTRNRYGYLKADRSNNPSAGNRHRRHRPDQRRPGDGGRRPRHRRHLLCVLRG